MQSSVSLAHSIHQLDDESYSKRKKKKVTKKGRERERQGDRGKRKGKILHSPLGALTSAAGGNAKDYENDDFLLLLLLCFTSSSIDFP